jgi:prolyl-tRNA synthetase
MAAAIEQNNDERGIVWPMPMAPFEVVICPIGWSKSEEVRQQATELHNFLQEQGIDVILDDRDARPGVMFSEWELIGVPIRVTVGERGLKDGIVEVQARRESESTKLSLTEVKNYVLELYNNLKSTL